MARNTSASCRLCRRAGEKLFLKGERCLSPKCAFNRRPTPPGMHGASRRRRVSDYGLQLREKQKAKAMYGVLERQFRLYYDEASKEANTGYQLLYILEHRLDNVVYRAGLAQSRAQARQLVNHGHVLVNGVKVGIPSYQLREGNVVESRDIPAEIITEGQQIPAWLQREGTKVTVAALGARDQIDHALNEQLIVEYYSR